MAVNLDIPSSYTPHCESCRLLQHEAVDSHSLQIARHHRNEPALLVVCSSERSQPPTVNSTSLKTPEADASVND